MFRKVLNPPVETGSNCAFRVNPSFETVLIIFSRFAGYFFAPAGFNRAVFDQRRANSLVVADPGCCRTPPFVPEPSSGTPECTFCKLLVLPSCSSLLSRYIVGSANYFCLILGVH